MAVVIVVLGGVWYFWGGASGSMPAQQEEVGMQEQAVQGQQAVHTVGVSADSSLDQDLAVIDAQASAAADASASAHSTSDTPIAQTE